MKAIHYDTEGDILDVTFAETKEQKQTGIELSDNIVLYYNPETHMPIKLLLLSYQALMRASIQSPILLDGLTQAPVEIQSVVTAMLKSKPLKAFIQVIEAREQTPLAGHLQEIFIQSTLQTLAAI